MTICRFTTLLLIWGAFSATRPLTVSACAQIDQPTLTIPGLDAVQPAVPSGEREFYGTPAETFAAQTPGIQQSNASDFSLTIRTELLSPFVDDTRVESNNIATRVMEADVRGIQTTTTNVQLMSTDRTDMARLNVVAQGTVSSNTIGYTPQARVTTAGNHTFNVTKPIFFDGNRFLTKQAYGGLQVRQTPQMVNSVASGLPLLGPLGDQIAWNEVLRRMPASDAIVAKKVADDVFPKVNSSVDAKLRDLNRNLQNLRQRLQSMLGNDSVEWKARSSTASFSTSATNQSVARRTDRQRSFLQSDLAEIEAAAVVFSEDSTNHLLSKLPLGNMIISDVAMQKLVQEFQNSKKEPSRILELLKNRDDWQAEPLLFSLKFADESPIKLLFTGGSLRVQLQFQVLPKNGQPSVMQRMSVRLAGKSTGNSQWSLYVADIDVAPASTNEQPDSWTNLLGNQAKTMVSLIPPSNLPRKIDLSQYEAKLPVLLIHRIQSINGQLRVSFKRDESEAVTSRRIPW